MEGESRGQWSSAITPNNHGPYITITAVLMMIFMILFLIARMAIRLTINGPFKADDTFFSVGCVFGFIQTIVTFVAINSGLGKRVDSISSLDRVEKTLYSADVLYVVTLCLSKLSGAFLIARLTRSRQHLIAAYVTAGLSLLWGVAAFLIVTIRCATAQPWRVLQADCTNAMFDRWIGLAAFGNAIELLLTLLPLALVWSLQMPFKSKVLVLFAFSFRLPIIVAAALRVGYLESALMSSNLSFDLVPAMVLTQIEMHYSLIASTIPCMRPFLKAFNTGSLGAVADGTELGSYGYGNSRSRKPRDDSALRTSSMPVKEDALHVSEGEVIESPVLRKDASAAVTQVAHDGERVQVDATSVTTDGSDRMIIRKTTEWSIAAS